METKGKTFRKKYRSEWKHLIFLLFAVIVFLVILVSIGKLQDPEYQARYAREKYLYTKEGEKILTIIEKSND